MHYLDNMWKFTISILLVLSLYVPVAVAKTDYEARVFLLRSSDAREQKSCTATLVKFDKCHLVTNAHCTLQKHEIEPYKKYETYVDVFGQVSTAAKVKVLKIDRSSDLAELSIPSSVARYCSKLPKVFFGPYRFPKTQNLGSFGFHGLVPQESFGLGQRWDVGAWTTIRSVPTSLQGMDFVLEVPRVEMTYGMSGGALLSRLGALYGINKSFVPFQSKSFVIPIHKVREFAQSKSVSTNVDSDSGSGGNTKRNGGENSGANGGENSGANGGENSGANGGENSGANGGENSGANGGANAPLIKPDTVSTDKLAFLREPMEGIVLKTDHGEKRLLALGQYQVDGFDNYRAHVGKNLAPIYFGDLQFENGKVDLITRLVGVYNSGKVGTFSDEKFYQSGSAEKLIVKGAGGLYEKFLEAEVEQAVAIKVISKTKFKILVGRKSYDYVHGGTPGMRDYFRDTVQSEFTDTKSFEGEILSNGDISLSEGGVRFKCSNQNYFKLICSSPTENFPEELSISRESLRGPINLRHSFETFDQKGNKVIVYRYGRLWSQDAEK